MNNLLYVLWNPSPDMMHIGPLTLHWYSMCWLVGLLGAYLLMKRLYKEQYIKDELFDPLFLYCFVGILIGARLGHCLFYQPDYFLSSGKHIVEMLLPIHFMEDGGWRFTGYEGLASHVGIWHVLDDIAIVTPITACFIRLGNLMNSEIIGKVTDVPWAFIFEKVDTAPRHPGQLYEALAYALLLVIGYAVYRKHPEKVGSGFYFGLCLTYIFTARFFIEFTKDIQVAFEASLPLDMGQLLSLPFIALGIACMAGGKWMRRTGTK